jgi:hypothetical protein
MYLTVKNTGAPAAFEYYIDNIEGYTDAENEIPDDEITQEAVYADAFEIKSVNYAAGNLVLQWAKSGADETYSLKISATENDFTVPLLSVDEIDVTDEGISSGIMCLNATVPATLAVGTYYARITCGTESADKAFNIVPETEATSYAPTMTELLAKGNAGKVNMSLVDDGAGLKMVSSGGQTTLNFVMPQGDFTSFDYIAIKYKVNKEASFYLRFFREENKSPDARFFVGYVPGTTTANDSGLFPLGGEGTEASGWLFLPIKDATLFRTGGAQDPVYNATDNFKVMEFGFQGATSEVTLYDLVFIKSGTPSLYYDEATLPKIAATVAGLANGSYNIVIERKADISYQTVQPIKSQAFTVTDGAPNVDLGAAISALPNATYIYTVYNASGAVIAAGKYVKS